MKGGAGTGIMTLDRSKWPRMKDGELLIPALGHKFNEKMRCKGCDISYAKHQDAPDLCPSPAKGEA